MFKSPSSTPPASCLRRLPAANDPGAAHHKAAIGLEQVANGPVPRAGDRVRPPFVLTAREVEIRDALLRTGAPESAALVAMMMRRLDAAHAGTGLADACTREAVVLRMEHALAAREQALAARGDASAALRDLGLSTLHGVMNRTAWTSLLAALPSWAVAGLSAGQVARAALAGSWSGLAALLPTLATSLPSLRSHTEFDALVQALPEAVRSGLASLHDGIAGADAQLRPNLAGGQLVPALAVAALLWQVQRRLPSPSGQLQGIARFIAELPTHWQRLAVVNGVGGAVLAPVAATPIHDAGDIDAPKLRPGAEEKAQRIAFQRWADQDLRPGAQRIRPTIDSIEAVPFDAAAASGAAHIGGAIQPVPDAARSPATRPQAGWFAWLVASLPVLKGAHSGFQSLSQPATAVEMTLMGESALHTAALGEVTATTPLVATDVVAGATAATRRFRRAPMAAAVIGVLGGAGSAAFAATKLLWPGASDAVAPVDLATQLAGEVVGLPGGAWGNGLDLLLGPLDPAPRSGRTRRAAPDAASAPAVEKSADLGQLHDVGAAQLDALRGDPALLQQLQSMRRWSVAVARDIATQPGWEWVATLASTEQELLVAQWQALRELRPALEAVEDGADATLRAALRRAGFLGDWKDIEVRLPPTRVAGMQVDDRLPLLQYCLARDAQGTPTFLRGALPVSAAERAQLTRFVRSADVQRLRADIDARTEHLRPALSRAVQSRLVIDALKAKALGVLGSGAAHRRGADVVLGFLRGTGAVERAALTYVDRLANGAVVTVPVPNYLVLRSVGEPGLHGQVVLYRSDLSSFQLFGDEGAFRQFLDTQRARISAFAAAGQIDGTLAGDIVQAAAPAQRATVAALVGSWEDRLARHQSGQRGPQAWNPGESFQLHFAAVDEPAGERQQWADALVAHNQRQAQQRLDRNLLRWSPLGIANVAADAHYRQQRDTALQSLRQHAHGSVADAMVRALRMAGFQGSLEGFDPDRVRLRIGGRDMALTDWATRGWQHHGLRRPSMPANLPDWSPHEAGLPNARLEPAAWLDDATMDALQMVAQPGDGPGTAAAAALDVQLQDPALRRAICVELETFADSNRLADAYIDHLRALPGSVQGAAFIDAMAHQLRARSAWMIETARQDGTIDAATHVALKAAHAALDPTRARPTSLQAVTLKGHAMAGMWALRTPAGPHVFLPDTAQGDRLLDARGFRAWLRQPGAEAYIRARAQYRHHPDLAAMFEHTSASRALPVGYAATRGPQAAAAALIAARIDDVDELTVSQLERFADTFSLVGALGVGAVCSLASGGTAAALCLAGTLGLVAESIQHGLDNLERGLVDEAIIDFGGGLVDLLDPGQLSAIPGLLFQLGKRSLGTASEAADAVRQWRLQTRAFRPDGQVSGRFAVPDGSLARSGLPMLARPVAGGGSLYRQGEGSFIQQADHYVGAALDEHGDVRLRMPDAPGQVGPPVEFRNNAWHRQERPSARRGTTTTSPLGRREWMSRLPEAENLPPDKLDELEAVFGVRSRDASPSADLRHVVQELTIDQRIERILSEPGSLGMPGDEAIILRAWADSPALGNGKAVETYIDTLGEWTRGARFGRGPVGLMVRVEDARTLPGIEALVDAADFDALAQRLHLPADSTRQSLLAATRVELAGVIKRDPKQSRTTWQRWIAMQHRLPTAADNLAKHFPDLTKAEAEEIVAAASTLQKREMEAWIFNAPVRDVVADTLTNRSQRQQRQAVVTDGIGTLADVQQLGTHLQAALPGHSITVRGDGNGGSLLLVASASSEEGQARVVFTRHNGAAMAVLDAQGKVHASWQHALFDQLGKSQQAALGDAASLRRAVVEHMRQTPLIRACLLPRMQPGSRVKRSFDACDPPSGVSLTPKEVAVRDAVNDRLYQVHQRAEREYAGIRALLTESEALKAEKRALQAQGQVLSGTKVARLAELAGMDLMHERNFRLKNFVAYELEGLRFQDEALELPDFPLQGGAYSGPPVAWMANSGHVGNTPVRRVFVADDQVVKAYKGKGKQRTETPIPPNDRFRSDYAMGADLLTTSSERARSSGLVTLTQDDLRARVGPVGEDGMAGWVSLADVDDAALADMQRSALPEAMQKLLGDARLLPSNVRGLTPGPYRVFEIRSCSEGKVLDGWFDAMATAAPELVTSLRAAVNTPERRLTGTLALVSDMHPCATSCDRRLTALTEVLPNLRTRVYYHFVDNPERTEWRLGLMVERELQRTRAQWEAAGEEMEQVRAGIRSALLDRAHPERREAAEAELLHNPPRATDLPVPRLWLPNSVDDESL